MSKTMTIQQKFIYLSGQNGIPQGGKAGEYECVDCFEQAIEKLEADEFDGIYIDKSILEPGVLKNWTHEHRILDQVPDGVALVDSETKIQWANERLTEWFSETNLVGLNFYHALGKPDVLGPASSPCTIALNSQRTSKTLIRLENGRYLEMHAVPLLENENSAERLIVTLRDVTEDKFEQEKLQALHRAGMELADLTPEEVCQMEISERIELLKSNIVHYTQHLLNFDVVEIRLVDFKTNQLVPLISIGIESEASKREIFAESSGNGVTGFVVATGKSYLCEDTAHDPLYVDGLIGARSSLTVPLVYHDQVIGSFNVESPTPGGFDESDLQFLEIFSRDIAVALNTLDLLVVQKANSAKQSIDAIYSAVALPIDEILNDTVHVFEKSEEFSPELTQRLNSILKNARFIKHTIHQVGQRLMPGETKITSTEESNEHPILKDKRVLVIDSDEEIRNSAHVLLERYGVDVETAHEGHEAILMIQNCGADERYSAIIADIRLPDLSGYELLMQLKKFMPNPPLILMTGFGYDPGHAIVKARKAGLPADAILYKPFRVDQLLSTIESTLGNSCQPNHSETGDNADVGADAGADKSASDGPSS